MKVTTFITVVVVLGYHVVNACPEGQELAKVVGRCVKEMSTFVEYKGEKKDKCPNLKKGIDCVENLLEACKDTPGFEESYSYIQKRLTQGREDLQNACTSSATTVSYSAAVLLSIYLAYTWVKH